MPTPDLSLYQQQLRPQHTASAQQASVKAVGLAAKATLGTNRADTAIILV